jgi:hypothetical protein
MRTLFLLSLCLTACEVDATDAQATHDLPPPTDGCSSCYFSTSTGILHIEFAQPANPITASSITASLINPTATVSSAISLPGPVNGLIIAEYEAPEPERVAGVTLSVTVATQPPTTVTASIPIVP